MGGLQCESNEKSFENSNCSQHKRLTRLYKDKISVPIIKEMSLAIHLFAYDARDEKLINIFFPSEDKNSRGKYEVDEIGMHIFKDAFHNKVIANFRTIICEIEKLII